jgi:hypothetical protein
MENFLEKYCGKFSMKNFPPHITTPNPEDQHRHTVFTAVSHRSHKDRWFFSWSVGSYSSGIHTKAHTAHA